MEKVIKSKRKVIFLSVFVLIAFIFYGFYHHVKLKKEYLPKIYQFEPAWVIQGQQIKIKGLNFGPTFKKGRVIVDDMEFLVKKWSENEIVAEAPVPSKKGYFPLSVETKEGKVSNLLMFEIKDPNYLKKYLK